MGRSYWFDCPKCGYRAKVSGRQDRGGNLFVQTIVCQDCKELYDVVTRLRVPEGEISRPFRGFSNNPLGIPNRSTPPTFVGALNRLNLIGAGKLKWLQFPAQCPVASFHRVKPWTDPDKCPRCGLFLEKNTLPYRIWE